MKRTSLHLDEHDLRRLAEIAQQESKATGSTVSASAIVRRLVRAFLIAQGAKNA
jgi:hypothetical protein